MINSNISTLQGYFSGGTAKSSAALTGLLGTSDTFQVRQSGSEGNYQLSVVTKIGETQTYHPIVGSGGTFLPTITNNMVTKGSETYFSGIHLKTGSAIPYIYSENDNINFRYVDSGGNTQYASINGIMTKFPNYLPLSGGTLTGNINTKSIYGKSDSKEYYSLRVTTEGTTTTNGSGRLYLGNSIASGTAGNASGTILMYGTGSNYITIQPPTLTANVGVTLPAVGGTIPVVSLSGTTLTIKTK